MNYQIGFNFLDLTSHRHTSKFFMVRLVTHNLLACHAKDCNANNFPLIFQNVRLEIREAEFNSDFIKTFLPKIEWNALVKTAREVSKRSLLYVLLKFAYIFRDSLAIPPFLMSNLDNLE